jgi:hypothetical protein
LIITFWSASGRVAKAISAAAGQSVGLLSDAKRRQLRQSPKTGFDPQTTPRQRETCPVTGCRNRARSLGVFGDVMAHEDGCLAELGGKCRPASSRKSPIATFAPSATGMRTSATLLPHAPLLAGTTLA